MSTLSSTVPRPWDSQARICVTLRPLSRLTLHSDLNQTVSRSLPVELQYTVGSTYIRAAGWTGSNDYLSLRRRAQVFPTVARPIGTPDTHVLRVLSVSVTWHTLTISPR